MKGSCKQYMHKFPIVSTVTTTATTTSTKKNTVGNNWKFLLDNFMTNQCQSKKDGASCQVCFYKMKRCVGTCMKGSCEQYFRRTTIRSTVTTTATTTSTNTNTSGNFSWTTS